MTETRAVMTGLEKHLYRLCGL